MEGVLVSAKRAGSTVTVTVATDRRGVTRSRARGSSQALRFRIRAIGTIRPLLVGSGSDTGGALDLKLRQTQDCARSFERRMVHELAGQRGDEERALNCTQCHRLNLIARSRYGKEWPAVLDRMGATAGQHAGRPQLVPAVDREPILAQSMSGREGEAPVRELVAKTAEYLHGQSQFVADVVIRAEDLSASQRQVHRVVVTERPAARKRCLMMRRGY